MSGGLLGRALIVLGALALLSTSGVIALAMTDHTIPDVLQNIAVGSMTAIGALLARGGLEAKQTPGRTDTPG